MTYLCYGLKEMEYLKNRDVHLGGVIERTGMIYRPVIPDPFRALIESIISQQISKGAANTIKDRMINSLGTIEPGKILSLEIREIREWGLSERKAGYIKEAAEAAISCRVDFGNLHTLSDQEVINKLTSLKGVGIWTAEMILLFSLGSPDIVSYSDLGIRRGMSRLYRLANMDYSTFLEYRTQYSPHGSVASLYLWAVSSE